LIGVNRVEDESPGKPAYAIGIRVPLTQQMVFPGSFFTLLRTEVTVPQGICRRVAKREPK
jgi:hypothetical protein